jgi:crotonobetainyl-CoA:carnitine CoA-transferase CaiB-like acyl-CoA transferase
VIAIYQVFDTADEPITLGLGNDAIWRRFWAAVGQPEYGEQAGLESNAKRRNARERIVATIADVLAQRTRADWLALFAQHRIPAGPINTIEQLAADPILQEEGLFFAIQGPAGLIPQVGLGIRFNGHSQPVRNPPPALGQDSARILSERLSMSPVCIAGLVDSEII